MDSLIEKLEQLIQKEKNIIPFLKELTKEDKKKMVVGLKKMSKKYAETYEVRKKDLGFTSISYEHKFSGRKRELVAMACFVCLNKSDFKRLYFDSANKAVSDEYIEKIIPWYVPNWYSKLINEENPWFLDYSKLMLLYKKEILFPSDELIVNKLPRVISESIHNKNGGYDLYTPEKLLEYKETLDNHIWKLFDIESSINWTDSYRGYKNAPEVKNVWQHTFITFSDEGKINRKQLLKQASLTATKDFNKNLHGWFFDLLIKLSPTDEEIIELQNDLFSGINSQNSKVVNSILRFFKKIANHKKFKYQEFLDNSSILLNSETKSVVNSTLMIHDKIARAYKKDKIKVCLVASEALINQDEKIQIRVAKLIAKYGEKSEELSNEINQYTDGLYYEPKELLKDFISVKDEIIEDEEPIIIEKELLLSEENKLPNYETLDELIFFTSQVLDNNEPYHFEQLLHFLPKLSQLITKENVHKLESIFKRAIDQVLSFDGFYSQIGILEDMTASYLTDYAGYLLKKHPNTLEDYTRYKKEKIKKYEADSFYKKYLSNHLAPIEKQLVDDHIYVIYKTLITKSKNILIENSELNLLSTPTHYPCWIEPLILIDRILAYEKANKTIDLYDFQIALGRLPIHENKDEVIVKVNKISNKEIKKSILYFYDQESFNISKEPNIWLQSIVSKNVKTDIDNFKNQTKYSLSKEKPTPVWDVLIEEYSDKDWDYRLNKQITKTAKRKKLKFLSESKNDNKNKVLKSIKSFFGKTEKVSSFYKHYVFKKRQYIGQSIATNDDTKFVFLSPNNLDAFLTHVISIALHESTLTSETYKKNINNILGALHTIWYRNDYGEIAHLFIATCLLCSNKVSRELANELFIKACYANTINVELLGRQLGKLQSKEYAPLKRFTDLLTESSLNISKEINHSLYVLLENMLKNMAKNPMRGTKKLLEIFVELKRKNSNLKISTETVNNLRSWKQTKSLVPIINKIIL